MEQKPLAGIKVIEMSTMIATPSCGRMLAYMGAEVIKVEALDGEPYRGYTSYTDRQPVVFDVLNSQKKSAALNVKNQSVKRYLLKMLKDADVFLSNIRADSLSRLGLDYDTLHALNPHLIYAHFSGYGEKGAMAKLPGYDSTSFLTRDGVYRDFTSPDHEPVNHVPGLGDLTCGLALTTNVLGALISRGKTGEGDRIESSLNQVGAWVMLMPMVYEQFGSWFQRKQGEPLDVANANMQCGDGEWIYYSCGTFKQWLAFCEAIGRKDLIDDARCCDFTAIIRNTPALAPDIARSFLDHPAEEWVGILRSHDVPCERHRHVIEMATDEQLSVNGFIYSAQYPNKSVSVPVPPILFRSQDLSTQEKGEALGAYTKEFLTLAGCPSDELAELERSGAVIVSAH